MIREREHTDLEEVRRNAAASEAEQLNARVQAQVSAIHSHLQQGLNGPPTSPTEFFREAIRTNRVLRRNPFARMLPNSNTDESNSANEHAEHNKSVLDLHVRARTGNPRELEAWLSRAVNTDDPDRNVQVHFDSDSAQAIVEFDLPSFDTVPDTTAFRFVRKSGKIQPVRRPLAERKVLYESLVAQSTLRCLHRVFIEDIAHNVTTLMLSGYVSAVDPATGNPVRPCLVTLRVTRDQYSALDLNAVDPAACLRSLHASISHQPSELSPVRPLAPIPQDDARFITGQDILNGLEHRPNLLELSPQEFEALISNLFGRMGLDTNLTRPSRDGGVDCVAFDMRPVLGGKIVIQAKRYCNTVGVSAVRDLYGTVLNEGACKGILVTTSGYGPSAFEFASNKPLELLTGSHLLALLSQWAGLEARISPVDLLEQAK